MAKLAPKLWSAMDRLFTDAEHEALLEDLLEDTSGSKVELFLRESLGDDHSDEEYQEALNRLEGLARGVTDELQLELESYGELLQSYPVLGHFFTREEAVKLIDSFQRGEDAELERADHYVGIYLLAKAEELQTPGFSALETLS